MSTYQTQRHMTCCTTGRTHSYSNFILCLFFYRMEPPSIIRVVLPFKLSWKNPQVAINCRLGRQKPTTWKFHRGGSLYFNWQRCRNRIKLDNYIPREQLTYHFHALNFDTFSSANQKSQNFPPLYDQKTSKHCSSLVQQHALF